MMSKGLILMILGMAIVFVLLTVLILFMNIVRVIVNGGKKKQMAAAGAGSVDTDVLSTGGQEIAAIAAAISVYTTNKRMSK